MLGCWPTKVVWHNQSLTAACIGHVITSRWGEVGFLVQLGAWTSFTTHAEPCYNFLNGPGKELVILVRNKHRWKCNLFNQSFLMRSDAFFFSASLFLESNEAVEPELDEEGYVLFIIFLARLLAQFLPLQVWWCHVGSKLRCMCLDRLFWQMTHQHLEVFTLPPHSIWNPCGIHVIPDEFHSFHMKYVLGETPPILVIFFHAYSTWNGQIPPGIHGIHMDYPHGFQMEYSTSIPWIPSGFQVDSMDSTWNNGIGVDSRWIPHNKAWNNLVIAFVVSLLY